MQAWISIADMPTNGTALIFDANTWAVHLPSSYSDAEVDLVWEHLQQELGRLDPLLRQQCARSIALLSLIARRWARGGRPQDVAAFVRAFIGQEVVEEVNAVLQHQGNLNTQLRLSNPGNMCSDVVTCHLARALAGSVLELGVLDVKGKREAGDKRSICLSG